MNKIILPLVSLILIFITCTAHAQTREISGTVVTFDEFPVKGLTVKAKKAGTETVTDDNGQFSLQVKNKDVIRIDDPVFKKYNQKIKKDDESLKINLVLNKDDEDIKKAVNTGYISQENINHARENKWLFNNEFSQFSDIYDAVQYAIPEARITTVNGQRGIQIRGAKTMTGTNHALFLVNGVIMEDVSSIVPGSIKNIKKLTSQQASMYGARGGNGVISIETE